MKNIENHYRPFNPNWHCDSQLQLEEVVALCAPHDSPRNCPPAPSAAAAAHLLSGSDGQVQFEIMIIMAKA